MSMLPVRSAETVSRKPPHCCNSAKIKRMCTSHASRRRRKKKSQRSVPWTFALHLPSGMTANYKNDRLIYNIIGTMLMNDAVLASEMTPRSCKQ